MVKLVLEPDVLTNCLDSLNISLWQSIKTGEDGFCISLYCSKICKTEHLVTA